MAYLQRFSLIMTIVLVLSMLASLPPLTTPVTATPTSEQEPNDGAAWAQMLTSIGTDSPVSAAINEPGDTDWYSFAAVVGRTYTIELFHVNNSLATAQGSRCTKNSYRQRYGLGIYLYDPAAIDDPSSDPIKQQCETTGGENVHTNMIFTARSSGNHFFAIFAHTDTVAGDYSVRVLPRHDEPGAGWDSTSFEPNNRRPNAYPIAPGYQNALASNVAPQSGNYATPIADIDWYRFSAEVGQTYTIELFNVSTSLTTAEGTKCTDSYYSQRRGLWILLYDPSGTEVSRQCETAGGENVHTSLIFTATRSGLYSFAIDTQTDSVAGNYSVRVLPRYGDSGADWDPVSFEPNNRWPNAYPISPGYQHALTSSIVAQSGSYAAPQSDIDWYRFPVEAGRTYTIELFNVSTSLTTAEGTKCTGSRYRQQQGLWILLSNPSGTEVSRQCETEGGENVHTSLFFTATSSGSYHFAITPHVDTVAGSYSLRVLPRYGEPGARWNPVTYEPNNRWQNARGIGVGEPYALRSTIESQEQGYSIPWADKDWFRFTAEVGESYLIEVFDVDPSLSTATGINCTNSSYRQRSGLWLMVYDPQGNKGDADCDNTGTGDVKTSVQFTATNNGLYHFQVMPHANTVAGDYHVRVTAASSQEMPPPLDPDDEYYAEVVDAQGNPVEDALVVIDGRIVTAPGGAPRTTDRTGILLLDESVSPGQQIVAVSPAIFTKPTKRGQHSNNLAYSVHTTSLGWNNDGVANVLTVSEPGPQRLALRQDSPLVLFNLVVSLEWAATDVEIDQIARAFRNASSYLFDVTDGQMAFGEVLIADNAQYWADADVQFLTNNTTRPHAYIRGITAEDTSHVIRLGRAWNGSTGNQGPWDEPDGYRTIVHEFGHYALGLYDSYLAYSFGDDDSIKGIRLDVMCTDRDKNSDENDATNATIMDYQYTSSELAMQGVNGLWTDSCEQTAQWQFNEQSDWETLLDFYSDTQNPPRWTFTTPRDRGAVLAGPAWPKQFPAWPLISRKTSGQGSDLVQLTVVDPTGQPASGVIVALYRPNSRPINQGLTDTAGRLDIYGAKKDDRIRIATMDGSAAASTIIADEKTLTLSLKPVKSGASLQVANGTPHLRVIPQSSPTAGQVTLLVQLNNFGDQIEPRAYLTAPGSENIVDTPISYSAERGAYTGEISFSADRQGTGSVWAAGDGGNSLIDRQSTYRLQQISPNENQEFFSDDGNLQLQLVPGSVPGALQYLAVMSPGALPGPLPNGLTLVGDAYDITISNAVTTFEHTALLRLHFDSSQIDPAQAQNLAIYRWNPNSGAWEQQTSTVDSEFLMVSAPVENIGTYALLASATTHQIWLPVLNGASAQN